MTIYHARPKDLHAPGEHCNTYDCTGVVMKYEHDAIAARLAEAERKLADIRAACDHTETGWVGAPGLRLILDRASGNGPPALCGHDDSSWCDEECKRKAEAFKKWHADSGAAPSPTFVVDGYVICKRCGASWDEHGTEVHEYACPDRAAVSAPACDHRGHPDWIPVPKPAVAAAKKFCTDCGQYLRPPETAAYGYSLDTEVCWHGEPKALCPQCTGDQWMIPAGKPEAWGAANDQEALLHAIEACTRSRPNDGRRWAMWPAETI